MAEVLTETGIDSGGIIIFNLDVFRMVANSEIQADFQPAKMQLRADPIDNQRGEFEYENEGLPYACLIVSQERLSMEELPFD